MADAARTARAAALEEKKRRLEELKARRLKRGDEAKNAPSAPKSTGTGNLDEYIDDLLKTSSTTVAGVAPAAVEKPPDAQPPEDSSKPAPPPTTTTATATDDNNVIAVAVAPAAAPPVQKVETFTISTQTEKDDLPPDVESEEEEEAKEQPDKDGETKTEAEETAVGKEDSASFSPKILSPEQTEAEIVSKPFSSFLNTASKKVERVLGTPLLADLLVNYVGEGDDDVDKQAEKASDSSRFVSVHQVFECAKWTATRDVTDMDWSPLHRDFMLSSYHMQSSAPHGGTGAALSAISPDATPSSSLAPRSGELQSDGLALVWNLSMPSRPEHIFTCGSPVLTSRFHPTEAPLVVGACYSGQIVVWDVRAGRLPVQRSSLTTVASATKGHAHPICSMEIVEGGVSILFMYCIPQRS